MTVKGHVLLASAITLQICHYVYQNYSVPSTFYLEFYMFAIIGSVLPDIDESNSYIGNKFKIFSMVFSAFVKHRTFTHYFITPIIIVLLSFFTQNINLKISIIALAVGILLHDLGDMLTVGGIRGFFFPLFPNQRIAVLPYFARFKTFSIQEYFFIIFILFPINLYSIYQLYTINFFGGIFGGIFG